MLRRRIAAPITALALAFGLVLVAPACSSNTRSDIKSVGSDLSTDASSGASQLSTDASNGASQLSTDIQSQSSTAN